MLTHPPMHTSRVGVQSWNRQCLTNLTNDRIGSTFCQCVCTACALFHIAARPLWLMCRATPNAKTKGDLVSDSDLAPRPPQDAPRLADLPPAGAWLQDLGMVLDEIGGTRVTAHLELGPQ